MENSRLWQGKVNFKNVISKSQINGYQYLKLT